MHDGIEMEKRGVPAGVIVTDAFVDTTSAMAAADGLPGYRFAVVPHPTADMDDRTLDSAATSVVDQLLAFLLL